MKKTLIVGAGIILWLSVPVLIAHLLSRFGALGAVEMAILYAATAFAIFGLYRRYSTQTPRASET